MNSPVLLGIEIGGTKLQLGLGSDTGQIRAIERRPIVAEQGAAAIREQIRDAAQALLTAHQVARPDAVAVGFGGPVNSVSKTILASNQVGGWNGFPLGEWLAEVFRTPHIGVHNDSDTAALAEATLGAGVNFSPLLYVNSGSGVGGGLVVDGRVYTGAGRGALEIGHVRVYDEDSGIVELESVASGWGIARNARYSADDKPNLSAEAVAEAARRGEAAAQRAINRAVVAMSEALAQAVNLLAPQRIVLGGGVSLMGVGLWLGPIRDAVRSRVYRHFVDTFDVVPAALGQDVVVHGALILAGQALQHR